MPHDDVILSPRTSAWTVRPSLEDALRTLRPAEPTASLTVQIFNYAISPYEDWHDKAWGAALCLLLVIGILSLVAKLSTRRRVNA